MARIDSMYPESVKVGKPLLSELPKGWEQKSLDNYLNLESRKVNLENDKEYDLVTVKRSRGGVVRREHLKGRDISVKSQFYIKEGDFLISKRQIVHGACGIVPRNLNDSIVSNEYSVFTAKENFYLPFLEYLSETLYFQQVCFHSSIGVHIEKMIFKLDEWFKWSFNIPPLAEQKRIAEILLTWDKAIETVEKLVANSQRQKKALMQQLLTGQKRLLDDNGVKFGDEWEEKSIKSILTISKGQQLNRDTLNTTSVYPVINGGIVPSGYTDDFNTNANTITISEGGNSCGYVSFQKTDFWCGGHCYALKKLKLNLEFTYHLLKFNEIQIMRLRVGSGLPNIQKKDLENLEVSFPTNSHEQEKIAQVLTLADQEIELYQQQLDKLKLEKKALMQQLLTGQKRVKVAA